MKQHSEYAISYSRGFTDAMYQLNGQANEIENPTTMGEIGYNAGIRLGKYCFETHMSMSEEQLLVRIDKDYTHSLEQYRNGQSVYVQYKSGFVEGKSEMLERIFFQEGNLLDVPEVDKTSVYSIGYSDGYHYYLEQYLKNKKIDREGERVIDSIVNEAYAISSKTYDILKEDKSPRSK